MSLDEAAASMICSNPSFPKHALAGARGHQTTHEQETLD